MSKKLLEKIRLLNQSVQTKSATQQTAQVLCEQLASLLQAEALVCGNQGEVVGHTSGAEELFKMESVDNRFYLPSEMTEILSNVYSTKENVDLAAFFYGEIKPKDNKTLSGLVFSLSIGRKKHGSLLIFKDSKDFDLDEIALGESMVLPMALVLAHSSSIADEEKERQSAVVKSAINTLSYSEIEAMHHIFDELGGEEEGLLIASKVADNVGITRSVIVNALRKCESAGVIESRSLGMKGTYIKVLNTKLIEELNKSKKSKKIDS